MEFADVRYKELAQKSGVAERALYNYVASKNPSMPPADVAVKLAEALDTTVEYLVKGTDSHRTTDIPSEELKHYRAYKKILADLDAIPEEFLPVLEAMIHAAAKRLP